MHENMHENLFIFILCKGKIVHIERVKQLISMRFVILCFKIAKIYLQYFFKKVSQAIGVTDFNIYPKAVLLILYLFIKL